MSKKRAPRRDNEVDKARTLYWFLCLKMYLGDAASPRDIQRIVAPTPACGAQGEPIKNNKFLNYSRGRYVPNAGLVNQAATLVPRSAEMLNHELWTVLRTSGPIRKHARAWVGQLDPEIQAIVIRRANKVGANASRHTLGMLERRFSLDSLAAQTILLRLHHEEGNTELAWLYAHSIFRVLLMLAPTIPSDELLDCIFQIFVKRVFSLVSFEGKRMSLENYDYVNMSWLLMTAANELEDECEAKGEQKRGSGCRYPLAILDGTRKTRLSPLFQIPLVPLAK
jgi:hypothetical protein